MSFLILGYARKLKHVTFRQVLMFRVRTLMGWTHIVRRLGQNSKFYITILSHPNDTEDNITVARPGSPTSLGDVPCSVNTCILQRQLVASFMFLGSPFSPVSRLKILQKLATVSVSTKVEENHVVVLSVIVLCDEQRKINP